MHFHSLKNVNREKVVNFDEVQITSFFVGIMLLMSCIKNIFLEQFHKDFLLPLVLEF